MVFCFVSCVVFGLEINIPLLYFGSYIQQQNVDSNEKTTKKEKKNDKFHDRNNSNDVSHSTYTYTIKYNI